MKEHTFQTHYPDYNVLDKWSSPDWDDQTREVVRQLDAGPHWNPVKDFVSDEIASRGLFWTDERITGGDNR